MPNIEIKPLRDQLMTCKDFNTKHRYISVDETHDCTRTGSENRLAKIYIRSNKMKNGSKVLKNTHDTNTSVKSSAPRNDYMPQTTQGSISLKLTKPISRGKLRDEIWRLPKISHDVKRSDSKRHQNSLRSSWTNDI